MADLNQLQQQRERSQKRAKKNTGGWIWIVFIVIGILSNLDSGEFKRALRDFQFRMAHTGVDVGELLAPIFGVIVLVAVVLILRKAIRRRAAANDRPYTAARTSAAVQRRDPRSASFTKPEAACIVCDHTGEDHFVRDKARRIAQLDEWLKNGLIEKDEYRVLKARYEQDI